MPARMDLHPRKRPNLFSIQLADAAAIGHFNAGLELYRKFEGLSNQPRPLCVELDVNRTIELGVPAVTNLALGLELLLKVHHFQTTGNYPSGHNVKELGSSLPNDALDRVRAIYKALHKDPKIPKGVEFRLSGGSTGYEPKEWTAVAFSTYDLAIEYVGPMYVRWRYIYEEFQEDLDIRISFAPLYFLAMSVHKAIREYKGGTKIEIRSAQSSRDNP